jgi:hypothetical protein
MNQKKKLSIIFGTKNSKKGIEEVVEMWSLRTFCTAKVGRGLAQRDEQFADEYVEHNTTGRWPGQRPGAVGITPKGPWRRLYRRQSFARAVCVDKVVG